LFLYFGKLEIEWESIGFCCFGVGMMEGGWGRDEGDGMVDIARTSFSGRERTWDTDAVVGEEEILDMKERNW